MAFIKYAKIVSPAGTALWPKVSTVDEFKGSLTYNTKLILDPSDSDHAAYIAALENHAQAAYNAGIAELTKVADTATGAKKAKAMAAVESLESHAPIQPSYNEDGTPDGKGVVTFKRKAQGVYASGPKTGQTWKAVVGVFDANKQTIPSTTEVGTGSIMRVSAEVVPFCMASTNKAGISLKLSAVQVTKLVEGAGGDDSGDFDVEEGYATEDLSGSQEEYKYAPPSVVMDDEDF